MALNFGRIYRDIEGIVLYFSKKVKYQGPATSLYDAGYMVGDIIQSIFKSPQMRAYKQTDESQ